MSLKREKRRKTMGSEHSGMIDNFALGLTHVLMMIAAVLLLRRPDLDDEPQGGTGEPPLA